MYYRDVRGSKWEILGSVSHRHNPICCGCVCVLRQRAIHSWPSSDPLCWVVPQILASCLAGARFLLGAELIFPSSHRWKPEAELMLLGSQEVHTHIHTPHTHTRRAAIRKAQGFEKWGRTRSDSDYSLGKVKDKRLFSFAHTLSERNLSPRSLCVYACVFTLTHVFSFLLIVSSSQSRYESVRPSV